MKLKKTLVLTICLITQNIFALDSDFKQSIYFQAENTNFNHNQNTFTSSGNIEISQGTILIQASKATGSLRNGAPYQITLTGNPVKFQQKVSQEKGMAYGKANSVIYNSSSSEIILKGNASIIQNGASINGETLRYNLTQGDIEAKGSSNKRIQLIIPPQKDIQIKPLQLEP